MKQRISQTFPAVFASVGFTVPSRKQSWKLVSVCFVISTSAVAGNRLLSLTINDSTVDQIMGIPAASVGPSSFQRITFAQSLGSANIGVFQTIGFGEELWIQPQWNVVIACGNSDAADTIGPILIQSEVMDRGIDKGRGSGQESLTG